MREQLNNNPIAKVLLVGLLVVAAAIFILKPGGGEEAEDPAASEVTATVNGATATGTTPGEAVEGAVESLEEGAATATAGTAAVPTTIPAPPPPAPVTAAYEAGKTVVLLVVDDGGIDDALTEGAAAGLASVPEAELFVVPAARVSRYAAITVGLDLSQVPALVVMRPKNLSHGIPQATVDYGFQTPQSIVQAVVDAGYKGPEPAYHPG